MQHFHTMCDSAPTCTQWAYFMQLITFTYTYPSGDFNINFSSSNIIRKRNLRREIIRTKRKTVIQTRPDWHSKLSNIASFKL